MTNDEVRTGRSTFERLYRTRLSVQVKAGATLDGDGAQARRLGRRARTLGIRTLTLARIHDRALAAIALRGDGTAVLPRSATARADAFFAEAAAPMRRKPATAHGIASESPGSRQRSAARMKALRDRLRREEARRKALQAALAGSELRHLASSERSRRMEERLRHLSRRLLNAQEEERVRISRDLHDAIGQTLVGINVGLATLQQEAMTDSKEIVESIALTQALVERSMNTVHAFARELRPTLLDDLGLVPALRSHVRAFGERAGVRVRFSAAADAARLAPECRIALFRVAQEALSNVARHAHAREVSVVLRRTPTAVRLEVRDDGGSFDVERVGRSKKNRHLGLLGMQERMDMVGGTFSIESAIGKGTTVRADAPMEMAFSD